MPPTLSATRGKLRESTPIFSADIPGEEWRQVLEGFYEVSNLGRVRRAKPACGTKPGRLIRCRPDDDGYLSFIASINGTTRYGRVHVLVAEAFLGPRQLGAVVDHKYGNKQDNRPSQLEWVTPVENERRATSLGLKAKGSRIGASKLTESQVKEIRRLVGGGMLQKDCAKRFGVYKGTIHKI